MSPVRWLVFCFVLLVAAWSHRVNADQLLAGLTVTHGPINAVVIGNGDDAIAVYHSDGADVSHLLLTHHRRDVAWPARLVPQSCRIVAPESERGLIETPQTFWESFVTTRFHDYAQQSTKVLAEPLAVAKWVQDGDTIESGESELEVIATPGFTRGSVSYVTTIAGKKVAFTGDLIYGDGQLLDLYSFQDEIPEANVRGYHGYGGRFADLVKSLQKVAALKPDLIVPARGPVIDDPTAAIEQLIGRVRALYANYLSTSALNWYFKEDRMRTCGQRVLAPEDPIELMDYSLHQPAPDWVFENATSRLLISDSGHAFLLDCGYDRVIEAIKKLMEMRIVTKVDGIFVTHYHDDHTDRVQAASMEFDCPVYATAAYVDVLEHPGHYHLPAMTSNPISPIVSKQDGETMRWQEFEFTFHFFPGQTFYHGGLLVRRETERPIFFIGDSFAPSGIDDYCVLNRNLVHDNSGYPLCFSKLRSLKEDVWLVNEHIPFVFEFSNRDLDYLQARYQKRVEVLREIVPWDDPNYGIDEQWAMFYPYGVDADAQESIKLQLRVENHSPTSRTFTLTPHATQGVQLLTPSAQVTLAPREVGSVEIELVAPEVNGVHLVTADVASEGMDFREWAEAMVIVKP